MVIVVTGEIGIGKSTVCEKTWKMLLSSGYSCSGILTSKAGDGSLSVLDILSGETRTLANTRNMFNGLRTGKYFFSNEGIEFGLRAIESGADSDVLFVDELGHLELAGKGFALGLELIKTKRAKNFILVIRKELLPRFLSQLGKPVVFETTLSNRDELPQKICAAISASLSR